MLKTFKEYWNNMGINSDKAPLDFLKTEYTDAFNVLSSEDKAMIQSAPRLVIYDQTNDKYVWTWDAGWRHNDYLSVVVNPYDTTKKVKIQKIY